MAILHKFFLFLVIVAVLIGCSVTDDNDSTSSSSSTDTPQSTDSTSDSTSTDSTSDSTSTDTTSDYIYSDAAPYLKIDFDDSSEKSITLSGVQGKSIYLVKTNMSHTSSVSGSATGYADLSVAESSAEVALSSSLTSSATGSYQRVEYAKASEFNANPPAITTSSLLASKSVAASSSTVVYGGTDGYSVGDTKTFWVEDASGAWVEEAATLQAVGRYCYVWVADDNFDDSSTSSTDNKITQAEAEAFQAKFDGTSSADYDDGIFKLVTNLFGYEYGGGDSGDGGRDGDQHITIFLYDIDGDYSATQSSGTVGYFWAKDYYTTSQLSSYGYKSNYCEMFYIDAYFADCADEMVYSTLAHEYQHMIDFNVKYVQNGESSSTWYNEMLSMLSEDALTSKLGTTFDDAPTGRLYLFNRYYYAVAPGEWNSSTDFYRYVSYSAAYTFGAYLARNYGGADLISKMGKNDTVDEDSITAALHAEGYTSETFDTVLEKYGQALVFSEVPSGSDVVIFNQDVDSTVGDITYSLSGFDLWTLSQYYSGAPTKGPYTFSPDITTQTLRPCGSTVHTATSWKNLSEDTISITLHRPDSDNVVMYLMVK